MNPEIVDQEFYSARNEYAQKHHIELVEISYKDKKYERVTEILQSHGII